MTDFCNVASINMMATHPFRSFYSIDNTGNIILCKMSISFSFLKNTHVSENVKNVVKMKICY